MDFFAHLQMMRVPGWARITIYLGFVCLMTACGFLGWQAVRAQAPDSWLTAAVALFAAIFPLMVIILVATTIHAGVKSIREETDRFLDDVLPATMTRLPEQKALFRPWDERSGPRERERHAKVEISHCRGDCFADYRISYVEDGSPLVFTMRVEMNIRRLNFNLYLPQELIRRVETRDDPETLATETIRRRFFPHTLQASSVDCSSNREDGEAGVGAYVFHERVLMRVLDGRPWYVLVGSCRLPRDVLWNPAETLFVAQDLMFMVRAMVNEGAELFAEA